MEGSDSHARPGYASTLRHTEDKAHQRDDILMPLPELEHFSRLNGFELVSLRHERTPKTTCPTSSRNQLDELAEELRDPDRGDRTIEDQGEQGKIVGEDERDRELRPHRVVPRLR